MRRVASVWLPAWASDLAARRWRRSLPADTRRPSGPPFILLKRTDHAKEVVAACCAASLGRGVAVGMTIAHARALLPQGGSLSEPLVESHRPEADAEALEALARWALRIAPLVAVDPPDGLLLDFTGCHMLYRDEQVLLRRMMRSFSRLGLFTRMAIAETFTAAGAVARGSAAGLTVVPPGDERAAIGELPTAALRLDGALTSMLQEVGIERIGELLPLPRAELARRYGPELSQTLDRALGFSAELVNFVQAVEPLRVEQTFSGPVLDLQAILLASRMLLDQLASQLLARESGVRRLEITLDRIDTLPLRRSLRFSRPTRRAAHLWALLRPRLEALNLGFGVERVELLASVTARLKHEQELALPDAVSEEEPMAAAVGELIDTLTERLGSARVLTIQPVASYIPERTMQLAPASSAPTKAVPERPPALDRPSCIFPQPELVEVMALTPDGPPYWMRWRQMEYRLGDADGPERINPEWWRDRHAKGLAHRDYFRVQTDRGEWLWLFRAASNARWYVHGAWA